MKLNFLQFLKENHINEAQFKEDKLSKVIELYGRLFGKEFGGPFVLYDLEFVKRRGEKFKGYRTLNPRGYQLRFNFEQGSISKYSKTTNKDTFICQSIDYWSSDNKQFDKPTLTCTFSAAVNVRQIYEKLCKLLKAEKVGVFNAEDVVDLNEASEIANTRAEFLSSKGFKRSNAYKGNKHFNQFIKDKGLEADWAKFSINIEKGKQETNSTQDEFNSVQKQFDDHIYADPKTVFKDIESLATLAANKDIKSLIICGLGGIGKTYHVTKALNNVLGPDGNGWHYHSGAKITPRSMYSTIFFERNDCVVMDDADSILTNPECILMLKSALGTSGDNTFEYLAGTENVSRWSRGEIEDYCRLCEQQEEYLVFKSNPPKEGEMAIRYPSKFYFTGSLIMISNMRADKIEPAILSRSMFIDVYSHATDIRNRIEDILRAQGYNEKDITEVLDALSGKSYNSNNTNNSNGITYLTPEIARKDKSLTVRSAVIALKMKENGTEDWQRLASIYA